MKTIEKKDFDCVESVRQIRTQIAKELEGKTSQEILAYFYDHGKRFNKRLMEKTSKKNS